MAFNSLTYRDELITLPTSVAHPSFSQTAAWTKDGSGHCLVTKNCRDNLVGVLVGKISDHRLFCSPSGNYCLQSKFSSEFCDAKFQLNVGIPDEPALIPIFRNSVSTLLKLQKSISTTNDNRYLLEDDGDLATIRFSMKMFDKRVCFSLLVVHNRQNSLTLASSNSPLMLWTSIQLFICPTLKTTIHLHHP